MSKFCVKKPYTVVVAVVLVLVLGVISFLNMTTDLLPSLELPYVVAVATYPGASPEKVERSVTEVLESAFGTVNGVANLSSVSSENMSLLILEFESSTNMDTAMVDLSTAADQVSGYLPDTVASPMLLRISPDMLPVVVASVDMEGMDIYELTRFVQEDVTPYLERQAGVASVDGTGLVEKTVEVRLDQSRIDALNDKVLASVNDRMADAQAELADAKQKLADGRAELDSAETELEDAQAETGSELGQASAQVDAAVAQASALASQLTGLQASKAALEAERDIRWKAMVAMAQGVDTTDEKAVRDKIEEIAAGMQALYEQLKQPDVPDETPLESLLNGLPDDNPLKASLQALIAQGCTTVGSVKETAKTIGAMPTRLDEIDAALADLGTEILAAEQMKKAADEGLAQAKDYYAQIEAGKIAAAAGFGSGSAQIAAGRTALEEAEAQLEEAEQQLAEARAAALESADITGLLSGQTIAGILTAQNFAMPAGYISGGEGKFMLRIGDEFASLEELENALLVHMDVDGVGDVRLSDVADVVVTDNAADSYARVNGNQAVILSVSKASTAGTSDVSKAVNEAIGELEARYEGLRITPLMDQGQYIKLIVNSVLSNLAWGGALAVLVLALFLKSLRPTLVVAFSNPISVLFALVLMYFSGVTLNIVSLSGLALGVGMLVDNSIVVMENIYRLRSQGMPAARAAVKGAGQVAAAIAASTFTTVCVFLPIVFTEGLTRQLFVDMGLTIAYSLCASLAVALTLVPTLSATLLRREEQKAHPWFDRMVDAYEKALRFCLRHKAVPLAGSLALLALAVWQTTRIGLTFMPEMGGNQMTVSVTVPEGYDRDEAYGLADAVMERSLALLGVV